MEELREERDLRCEGLEGDQEELVKVDWCPSPCWTLDLLDTGDRQKGTLGKKIL